MVSKSLPNKCKDLNGSKPKTLIVPDFPIHTRHVYNRIVPSVTISMSKRLNIILPETTLQVLDRVAPKGDRSRFISQAVLHYVQSRSASNLRERLKQGALANAGLDLEIAEEWFPAEQEVWKRLDREEKTAKTSRVAAKSTSRRSTQR